MLAGVTLVGATPLAATSAGGPFPASSDVTPMGAATSATQRGDRSTATPDATLNAAPSTTQWGDPFSAPPGVTLMGAAPPAAPLPGNPRAGPVFSWPLDPPHQVLRPFEAPAGPYGPGHRGVDLGGTPGQAVRAAAAGTVVFAGQVAGRGVISVDHVSGLRTTYEPVTPSVTAGQQVAAGEVLGQLMAGHPGCPAAACLHWGVRRGGDYLDPLGLLGTGRVRLLPWED